MKKRLSLDKESDPVVKDKLPYEEVIVEIEEGEVTEQMRVAWRFFWHSVLGRLMKKDPE
ncbi:MAG: hypothetical protein QOG23_4620 [Blastocatellia bacterium]|jgi:hypothetical protein|nr:hypothetical protein [Blastocatellia bacterium]